MRIKILAALICTMLLTSWAMADDKDDSPVKMKIFGGLTSYYKQQNNFSSPLDGDDRYLNTLSEHKSEYSAEKIHDFSYGREGHGANNRSSQKVRAEGSLGVVVTGGEHSYEGMKWYNIVALMQLNMSPSDPDVKSATDGEPTDNVNLGEFWVRYSPMPAIGIKVGVQTVMATASEAILKTGFTKYDIDNDFPIFASGALDHVPGVGIDINLPGGFQVGFGQYQGIGDLAALAVLTPKENAVSNDVFWVTGKTDYLDFSLSQQNGKVGGYTDEDSGRIINVYQHEKSYTVQALTAMGKFGSIKPFIVIQNFKGEKVGKPFTGFAALNKIYAGLNAYGAGLDTLKVQAESDDFELSFNTIGLVWDLAKYGKFAMETTSTSTPGYNEDGMAPVALELGNTMHLQWEYTLMENVKFAIFHYAATMNKNNEFRQDIQTAKRNRDKVVAMNSPLAGTHDYLVTLAENFQWTDYSSTGVGVDVSF